MLGLIIVFNESTSEEDLYLYRESLVYDSEVGTIWVSRFTLFTLNHNQLLSL
jgi:hypothetical protein